MKPTMIRGIAGAILTAGLAAADTTVDPSHPYAYAANAGWMSAAADTTHGVQLSLSYCSGYMWSANCGWIGFGNGPANGWQYTNSSTSDWGVNHDGMGNLSGYAYGSNIGWVTFEQTYGKPRVDLQSGILSGAAWSPNIGWITFSNTTAYVRMERLETAPDVDADGISDAWEYRRAGDLETLGPGDSDGDGASDAQEFLADTDPQDADALLRVTSLSREGGDDLVAWTAQGSRLYRLEASPGIGAAAAWSDSGTGLMLGEETGAMSRSISAPDASNRFYRVKALLPFSE